PTPITLPVSDDAPRAYREEKARVLVEFERAYLHRVMKVTQGNVSRAARHAGKERRAFRRLLKKHGIERRQYDIMEHAEE
ncbi:MAG TPA: helix-turn-helix domain-containing protein, partial [Burkholderiales bacterium]|nr:helix-turn-helix domain-containing protein [Burkholderiales bacterium]